MGRNQLVILVQSFRKQTTHAEPHPEDLAMQSSHARMWQMQHTKVAYRPTRPSSPCETHWQFGKIGTVRSTKG